MDIERLPKHVAIIMDGNGRWAESRGLPRVMGHRAGVERVKKTVRLASETGISVLTLYAFSTENWKRPRTEVNVLMNLLVEFLVSNIMELHENGVRLIILGDTTALPEKVQKAIVDGMELTAHNTGMKLAIALNYGARQELAAAVRRIAAKAAEGSILPENITEDDIAGELYTAGLPDPDLIIRTSGELRLSNFLLFQSAYSELYFTDVFWPDLEDELFLAALEDYASRKRRYGGL